MTENLSVQPSPVVTSAVDYAGGRAVLTEANRHVDILYTSLVGVGAIVVMLLVGLALPVFGMSPVSSKTLFGVMVLTSIVGVGELCYINYRVHRSVTSQARLTEVIFNSLGQGFLSFNSQGTCGKVYSQACLHLLEKVPSDKPIIDVLAIPEDQRSDFLDWLEVLFTANHALGFDDIIKFLPQTYPHSEGKSVALTYRAVRNSSGMLMNIVVIATDQTDEVENQHRLRQQQEYVDMIARIFKERNQFLVTVTHIRKFVEETSVPVRQADATHILRALHTLKAATKHFHLMQLSEIIAALEATLRNKDIGSDQEFMKLLREGGTQIEASLKAILDQVGELIGQDYEGRGDLREIDEATIYQFADHMRSRNVAPDLVREYLSSIAAVPINECFRPFGRELRDLGEIMGKKIKPVRYTGLNPPVLTQPIQGLLFSLMHICRNIVDHGIEPAVTRLARGKEPAGQVTVHTDILDGGEDGKRVLQILISDDGAGIDPAKVRAKLAQIDPDGAWRHHSDDEVIQKILSWGVSTKDSVSDLSGRGVGMEAVEREVLALGGTIQVSSKLYQGTGFDIRIPYHIDFTV